MEENIEKKEIPKGVRIPFGVVLFLFALLCTIGTITIFIDPPEKSLIFALVLGSFMLLACLWVLEKSVRMVFGYRVKGGLMSPIALRVVSMLFLILPVAGIFTGFYKEKGWLAIMQAMAYISIFFGLNVLAKSRSKKLSEREHR